MKRSTGPCLIVLSMVAMALVVAGCSGGADTYGLVAGEQFYNDGTVVMNGVNLYDLMIAFGGVKGAQVNPSGEMPNPGDVLVVANVDIDNDGASEYSSHALGPYEQNGNHITAELGREFQTEGLTPATTEDIDSCKLDLTLTSAGTMAGTITYYVYEGNTYQGPVSLELD